MPLVLALGLFVVGIITWIAVRSLSTNIAFTIRFGVTGLALVVVGFIFKGNTEDGLVQAAGALLTTVGVVFFIFGVIAFIRAVLVGEFGNRE